MRTVIRLGALLACAAALFGQGTAVPTNTWVKVAANGFPGSVVGYDKLQWCANVHEACVWGDYHGSHSEKNETLVGWNYAQNNWFIHDTSGAYHTEHGPDGGHSVGLFSYDSDTGCLNWGFDVSGSNEYEHPYHLFCWDDAGRTARDLFPAPRYMGFGVAPLQSMSYNPNAHLTVMYPDTNGKTAVYSASSNSFTEPATTGTAGPSSWYNYATTYNANDHKTYYFGGNSSGGCAVGTMYNDVYSFDPSTNVWAKIATTGTAPTGRMWVGFAYSPVDNKFLVALGSTCAGPLAGIAPSGTGTGYVNGASLIFTGGSCTVTPVATITASGGNVTGVNLISGGNGCSSANPPAISTASGTGVTFTPSYSQSLANELWQLDPANSWLWTQLTPAGSVSVPAGDGAEPFEKFVYDPDDNAFILMVTGDGATDYAAGPWSLFPTAIYLYALSTPLNYGRTSATYTPPAGSLNLVAPTSSSQSDAMEPDLFVAGSTLYIDQIETGSPFLTTPDTLRHPSVRSTLDGITMTGLGSGYAALDPENGGLVESEKPKIMVAGSTVWEVHTKWSNNGVVPSEIMAKSWNGSAWVGGAIGLIHNSSPVWQSHNAAIAVGATAYIPFIEVDNSFLGATTPNNNFVYIVHRAGSSWTQDNGTGISGALNRIAYNSSTTFTRAENITSATDGTKLFVCWTETGENADVAGSVNTTTQAYCDQWSGGALTTLGGSLNQSGTSIANGIGAMYFQGLLYVAWTEHTVTGVAKVYVSSWNGSAWSLVGSGALNRDAANGWAFRPRLTNDGVNVILAHEEQTTGRVNNLYTDSWNGTAWTSLGGALNKASTGTVSGTAAAQFLGKPTVAWTESTIGNLKQVYADWFYNGYWNPLGTIAPVIGLAALPAGQVNTPYNKNLSVSGTPAANCSVTSGSLPTGLSLSSAGLISGTPTVFATSTFTVTCANSALPNALQAYSLAINIATAPLIVGEGDN